MCTLTKMVFSASICHDSGLMHPHLNILINKLQAIISKLVTQAQALIQK